MVDTCVHGLSVPPGPLSTLPPLKGNAEKDDISVHITSCPRVEAEPALKLQVERKKERRSTVKGQTNL